MSIAMLILIVGLLSLPCIAVGSAVFFLPYFRRRQRILEGEESSVDVARLQASVEELTTQVHQLEEEKEFYRELNSPLDTQRNELESEREPDSGGSH